MYIRTAAAAATTTSTMTTSAYMPYAPKMLYKLAKIHMNDLAICHFDIMRGKFEKYTHTHYAHAHTFGASEKKTNRKCHIANDK